MAEAHVISSKRRVPHNDVEDTAAPDVNGTNKRRAFLQTMGQQLREFGAEGTSPQDHNRGTFGTSPANIIRPPSVVHNAGANHRSVRPVDTPESDAAPGEEDELPAGASKSASRWLWKPGEVLTHTPESAVPSLAFEDLLVWSQSYFDHWHPAFPFLHAPSLLDYFRKIIHRATPVAPLSTLDELQSVIVRSVISISTCDRRQTETTRNPTPSQFVFHSINDAIRNTQLVLTEETSVLSLQALVSIQLFLITMHRYNAASRLQGLVTRMVFQLGLHRCPLQRSVPNKEAELRKRLFWSVLCLDRHISIRLGTPLGIRPDEANVCYPHTERHNDREDRRDRSKRDDRLDLLEFLARHADIRGSIMQIRHQTLLHGSASETDEALEMEAEHTRWWNMVDEYLSDEEQVQSISKAHQVTLIVLRFETILALNRSVLAISKKDAAYNVALQRCISASRSIINTLHKALRGFGAFDGSPGQHGYERISLLWPSFTWAVWMSTFVILSAATESHVAQDIALRLSDRSIQILKHLALRGTSWPDACIVAIQNLTTRLSKPSTRSSTAAPEIRSGNEGCRGVEPSLLLGNRPTTRQEHESSGKQNVSAHSIQSQFITDMTTDLHTLHRNSNVSQADPSSSNLASNIGTLNFPSGDTGAALDANNPTYDYLAGAANFLGIAHQYSDNPLPNEQITRLFNGEDAASWWDGDFAFTGNMNYHNDNPR